MGGWVMNITTNTDWKRIALTKIKVVLKSSSHFFMKSWSYSSASRWNFSKNSARALVAVPRRFGKRVGNALSIASSKLGARNGVGRGSEKIRLIELTLLG